jgi:hypothetical protein
MIDIDMVDPGFAARRRVEETPEGYVIYVKPAPIMGDFPERNIALTPEQYERYKQWRDGSVLIQDAFPELTPDQREVLMTGLSDDDFLKAAGDEDIF